MAQEEGKKEEEKLGFDSTGQAIGYISLAQARVLAMSTAQDTHGEDGSDYPDVPMAFDTLEAIEDEDFYTITLSFRPQGNFSGTPGQEQFFIEKEGRVAVRQVLSLPGRGRRFPVLPVAIGVVIVGVIVAVGAVFMLGGTSDDGVSVAVVTPTETPVATEAPTPTPNASSYYNKGADYSNDGKYQLAVDEYTKAIQLDPDYLFAYNNRGISYRRLGQDAEADADKSKACSLDSKYC